MWFSLCLSHMGICWTSWTCELMLYQTCTVSSHFKYFSLFSPPSHSTPQDSKYLLIWFYRFQVLFCFFTVYSLWILLGLFLLTWLQVHQSSLLMLSQLNGILYCRKCIFIFSISSYFIFFAFHFSADTLFTYAHVYIKLQVQKTESL